MNTVKENPKLHCHTEFSARDSACHIEDLVTRAKELGVKALSINDHGIMMGNLKFIKCCIENEIKPIPSLEGYIQEESDIVVGSHICLYPTGYESYSVICEALTDANANLINGKPTFNKAILTKHFGKGAKGHGKVYMTSACVKGVFANIMFANDRLNHLIELESNKMETINMIKYQELMDERDNVDTKISVLKNSMAENKKLSAKKYLKEQKAVDKLLGMDNYIEEKTKLTKAIEDSFKAGELLIIQKEELNKLTETLKEKKKEIDKYEKSIEKNEAIKNKIEQYQSQKTSEDELYKHMKEKANDMIEIFGKDFVFGEIQYHYLDMEKYAYPYIVRLCKEMGLKLIATNDSHYARNTPDDVKARQIQMTLRFDKYVPLSVDSAEYYLKSDEELRSILSEIYDKDVVEEAINNTNIIADNCNILFPDEKHYPVYPMGNAKEELREICLRNISKRYGNDWNDERQSKLEYELEVMDKLGVNDYICIVSEFIRYCKELDKYGYHIGPGRGSGAGSVVLYLTEITNVDPFKYNLIFERFLNLERYTMPDIDTDFSEEIRDKAIAHVRQLYGDEAVCSIMTILKQNAKASIKNAARVYGWEKKGAKVYGGLAETIAKLVPKDATLSDCAEIFNEYFSKDEDAMTIIKYAKLIEGTITGYSLHPAGIIIGPKGNVSRYIPLQYNTSLGLWGCQCDMVESEEIGLLKMDFLGLKTLDVETKCIRMIKKNYNVTVDLDNLPFEDDVFKEIYSQGNTLGVFQVESAGMKSLMKQLKPSCIEDIIIGISMYRPGPMDFIPKLIEYKNGGKEITYLTPELKPILSKTYGCIVYQEQVMQIVRDLAGYSLGQSDMVRRYMSKKKTDKLQKEEKAFIYGDSSRNIVGCIANGIDEKIAKTIFDQMIDFAKYAFNKSHAAAYAIVSYQTAWLKYHYPAEFLCASMSVSDVKKIPGLINEARRLNIVVKQPDINNSVLDFDVIDNEIVFGFKGIKGILKKITPVLEARKNGKFISFKDYILRGHTDKTVTENLIQAGAFDSLCTNRKALISIMERMTKLAKKIKEKQIDVNEKKELIKKAEDKDKAEKSYRRALKSFEQYTDSFLSTDINEEIFEDKLEKLNNEYEILNKLYVSGHPLDNYQCGSIANCVNVNELIPNKKQQIIGIIKDLKIIKRKKDGKEMAFFMLEDLTGNIDACCFCNEYLAYGKYLEENKVIKINGNVNRKQDDYSQNEDEEPELQFIIKSVSNVKVKQPTLIMSIPNIMFYNNMHSKILSFKEQDGSELIIHDRLTGEFRSFNFPVSMEIMTLKNEYIGIEMI